jgi:hypothetical protein
VLNVGEIKADSVCNRKCSTSSKWAIVILEIVLVNDQNVFWDKGDLVFWKALCGKDDCYESIRVWNPCTLCCFECLLVLLLCLLYGEVLSIVVPLQLARDDDSVNISSEIFLDNLLLSCSIKTVSPNSADLPFRRR